LFFEQIWLQRNIIPAMFPQAQSLNALVEYNFWVIPPCMFLVPSLKTHNRISNSYQAKFNSSFMSFVVLQVGSFYDSRAGLHFRVCSGIISDWFKVYFGLFRVGLGFI
jgi:hypothetical protein